MSAGAIGGTTSSVLSTGNAFGSMSSADFMRVLTTELSQQSPLDPQDSGALLQQLSNLRNIESQTTLQQKLESLVLQNQVAMAGGMIGKSVEGLDSDNTSVQGLVTAVRVQNGKATLELDSGKSLLIDRVTRIMDLNVASTTTN